MSILVDTSVWSLALRRKAAPVSEEETLKRLIRDGQVKIIGPVRQELLSGIPSQEQFEALKSRLAYFPDTPIQTSDYELAASFFNLCRQNGIQGSHIDFLICAVAASNKFHIYTTDKDFLSYRQHLPILLFEDNYPGALE